MFRPRRPIAAHELPFSACDRRCVSELSFGVGSGLERVTNRAQRGGVADGRSRTVEDGQPICALT